MGYPLRWEQLAIPEVRDEPREEERASQPSLRPYFRRIVVVTLSGAALLVLAVMGTFTLFLNSGQAPPLRLESVSAGAALAASPPQISRRVGYVVVSGSLVNRGVRPLDHAEAVVDLLDSGRRTLRSQSAMLVRDEVAPGQQSDYRVELADDLQAAALRVRFKRLNGSDLR